MLILQVLKLWGECLNHFSFVGFSLFLEMVWVSHWVTPTLRNATIFFFSFLSLDCFIWMWLGREHCRMAVMYTSYFTYRVQVTTVACLAIWWELGELVALVCSSVWNGAFLSTSLVYFLGGICKGRFAKITSLSVLRRLVALSPNRDIALWRCCLVHLWGLLGTISEEKLLPSVTPFVLQNSSAVSSYGSWLLLKIVSYY